MNSHISLKSQLFRMTENTRSRQTDNRDITQDRNICHISKKPLSISLTENAKFRTSPCKGMYDHSE